MRAHHIRLLLLALGSTTFAAGAFVGCGGGGSNGNGSGDDGGSQSDTSTGGGDDSGGGTDGGQGEASSGPQANANDVSVYLGQIARLDGSQSTPPDATFVWTIESVPAGSTITTGSLLNANGPKPSFTPDKIGDYGLKLTITSNAGNATKNVAVHAVVGQTFYVDYNVVYPDGGPADGGSVLTYRVVPTSGGDGGTPVACPVDGQGNTKQIYGLYADGLSSADQWEGPAGGDPRALFLVYDNFSDGGFQANLVAMTSKTTCGGANAPRVLDSVANGPVIGTGAQVNAPAAQSFSPDGNRVLYVKSLAGGPATISTIGFDGTGAHQVGSFALYPDGGAQDDAGMQYISHPPRWAPSGKIALPTQLNGSRFQVELFDDANGATPTLSMGCSGSFQHFDTLPNGDYVVEATLTLPDAGSALDIFVLHPNALTKECEIVRTLGNLPAGSTYWGMTLSPDKTRVAYTAKDSSVDAGSGKDNVTIYTAAVDGTTPGAPIPGVPYGSGGTSSYYYRPPRWVSGGASLSFEIANAAYDAGSGAPYWPSLAVAPASGGSFDVVAKADGPGHLIFSATACSISHGPGSALMAFGSFAAFLGLVVRRRRKNDGER